MANFEGKVIMSLEAYDELCEDARNRDAYEARWEKACEQVDELIMQVEELKEQLADAEKKAKFYDTMWGICIDDKLALQKELDALKPQEEPEQNGGDDDDIPF